MVGKVGPRLGEVPSACPSQLKPLDQRSLLPVGCLLSKWPFRKDFEPDQVTCCWSQSP